MNCSRIGGDKSGMCLHDGPALNLHETSVSKIPKINAQSVMKAERHSQICWRFSRIKYNPVICSEGKTLKKALFSLQPAINVASIL